MSFWLRDSLNAVLQKMKKKMYIIALNKLSYTQ